MTLLENWRNLAYGDGLDDKKKEELWSGYFTIEKGIYEQILANPTEVVEGTVKELAEKYDTEVMIMTGFLDGEKNRAVPRAEGIWHSPQYT